MARYFYTSAMREETIVFGEYQSTMNRPYDFNDAVNMDFLEKTFKGYQDGEYYYRYDEGMVELLEKYFYHMILTFTDPEFDEPTKTVSYYESLEKRERRIRTTSKVGKFIRKIAPYYNDKQIENLVDGILEAYKIPNYTSHVGHTREDFAKVYTMRPESGRSIGNYKCINASCMRDKFGGREHPCSVYGSGDFKIYYLLNEDGRIAARSIVCTKDNVYGPIYVSSKFAGKELEKVLEEKGFIDWDEAHNPWDEARLLKISCDDGWLAPYIDVCQSVEESDNFFFISYDNSEYNFCNTSGYVRRNCKCSVCDRTVNNYDLIMYDGAGYCDSCINHCDFTNEYTTEEVVKVQYGRSYYHYHTYCMSAAQEHAVYDEKADKWYTKEYYERVKKIEEERKAPPVPGDVVRIIGNSNFSCNHIGDIGILGEGVPGWQEVIIPGRTGGGCFTEVEDMIKYVFTVGDRVKNNGNNKVVTIIKDKDFEDDYIVCDEYGMHYYVNEKSMEVILTDVTKQKD